MHILIINYNSENKTSYLTYKILLAIPDTIKKRQEHVETDKILPLSSNHEALSVLNVEIFCTVRHRKLNKIRN